MPIIRSKGRGNRPHTIIHRHFNFGGKKKYKLRQDLWNIAAEDPVDVANLRNEWGLTKTQFRNLLNALDPDLKSGNPEIQNIEIRNSGKWKS